MQGFSEQVTELLLQPWRANTLQPTTQRGLSSVAGVIRQVHPLSASLEEIMEFLVNQFVRFAILLDILQFLPHTPKWIITMLEATH